MGQVAIFRDSHNAALAERLRADLVARTWPTVCESPIVTARDVAGDACMVFLLPEEADARSLLAQRAVEALGMDRKIILLDQAADAALPSELFATGVTSHLFIQELSYDRVFEDLFRGLVGPLPPWLDLRIRPTLMMRPTGVAWWGEDLFIADEGYEHVVRIGPTDSSVVIPGLLEPHHVHLDRRTLIVANKSADEILWASLDNNTATSVRLIHDAAGITLRRPHACAYGQYVALLADTDNNRVLRRDGEPDDSSWKVLRPTTEFRAPCAVHVSKDHLWVADTFNHRIVAFSHEGMEMGAFGGYGHEPGEFQYPVGIATWQDYVVVADEQSLRVQLLRLVVGQDGELDLEPCVPNFGAPWVQQPFGLSVNRETNLAVADRAQKCVWVLNLREALAESLEASG